MVNANTRKLQEQSARVVFYYSENSETWRGFQGRKTTALIILPDKSVVKGEAKCSLRDRFTKKKGRDIALGRAISNLENHRTTILNDYDSNIVQKILSNGKDKE